MATKQARLRIPGFDLSFSLQAGNSERLPGRGALRRLVQPAMRLFGAPVNRQQLTYSVSAPPGAAPLDAPPELVDRIASVDWYHTIELPYGLVTRGFVDHRRQVPSYGLPEDMRGMRALDVATFDGFWAFEMERRGADVVAVDIARSSDADIPMRWKERLKPESDVATGSGFEIVRSLLGSKVERRTISVYDLSPDEIGAFDVVMVSDLLQHLRDPQRALETIYSVTCKNGYVLVAEVFNPELDRPDGLALLQFVAFVGHTWMIPSIAALKKMMHVAGFSRVDEVSRLHLAHAGEHAPKVVLRGHPWRAAESVGR